MGTTYTDILVKSSIENVQNLVSHAFAANGFEVKWTGPAKGKAEKGSKGANVMLGALAQYYGVEFEIASNASGSTLRLIKSNTGWVGGYLGARKVEKQFQEMSGTLAAWFQQQGILIGMSKG